MNKVLSLLLSLSMLACEFRQQTEWDFMSFEKPAKNPVMQADSAFTFLCPVKNERVQWQKADVFNPAAIVKDGKIQGKSVINVLLEDYEIKVPGAVKKQISKSIEVTIDVMLEEVKQ